MKVAHGNCPTPGRQPAMEEGQEKTAQEGQGGRSETLQSRNATMEAEASGRRRSGERSDNREVWKKLERRRRHNPTKQAQGAAREHGS